jgi:hypothetical protein
MECVLVPKDVVQARVLARAAGVPYLTSQQIAVLSVMLNRTLLWMR